MADIRQLTAADTDGTTLGQSTADKISLYGVTPIAQRSNAAQAAAVTTAAVSTTTGAVTSWGFSTSTQANAIVSLVNELRAWAVAIGGIKGSS